MDERTVIFVLGMGRSGTSALTRVLSLCGASLPERLVGPLISNPRGHWEPAGALALNERFLARYNANFHDPTMHLQTEAVIGRAEADDFVAKIAGFLEGCPLASPLVIKEPRIAMVAGFWIQAARAAEFAVRIVVPVRHPAEVAASLATRDGASVELSTALWLKYNLLAERASRGLPRVFVAYHDLLEDWRRQVTRIATTLSVPLAPASEVDAFLSSGLRHQRAESAPVEVFSDHWVSRVYTTLATAARDGDLDTATMDQVFAAYQIQERAFRVSLSEYCCRYAPGARIAA